MSASPEQEGLYASDRLIPSDIANKRTMAGGQLASLQP
jgi:hypothetical protein